MLPTPQLYTTWHTYLCWGFTFPFQPFLFFLTDLAFLLITKHKKVVNIFSLCFYPVTINIFAKIKVWIHPQMRSGCFPASVSKYGPHSPYFFYSLVTSLDLIIYTELQQLAKQIHVWVKGIWQTGLGTKAFIFFSFSEVSKVYNWTQDLVKNSQWFLFK